MRILLVQSYLGRKEKAIYPLGLAYLAAYLKHHQVKAIDPNVLDNPLQELKQEIATFAPELVGVSLRNLDTTKIIDPYVYLTGFGQTLEAIKASAPQAGLIVGGSGFSIYAKELMNLYPYIDAGVFLEAEDTMVEVADNWGAHNQVKGLFLREGSEVRFTGRREFRSIEELPLPDWDTVPVTPYIRLLDAVGVQTKRGCGLKCAYCNYPFLNGASYRFRTVESVGEEIAKLATDYGAERFIFVDSVFNVPREYCEKIMLEIIRRRLKIKWTGWFNERFFDRELLELALQAGCEFFSFSPDGFADHTLKALGKNIRKQDILRVYALVRQYPQVKVGYNFFLNPPQQTFMDLLKLMAFYFRVKWRFGRRLGGFLLESIRIEPDTPIFEIAVQEGYISRDQPLAARNSRELRRLFYRPPKTGLLTAMQELISALKRIKRKLKPVALM